MRESQDHYHHFPYREHEMEIPSYSGRSYLFQSGLVFNPVQRVCKKFPAKDCSLHTLARCLGNSLCGWHCEVPQQFISRVR